MPRHIKYQKSNEYGELETLFASCVAYPVCDTFVEQVLEAGLYAMFIDKQYGGECQVIAGDSTFIYNNSLLY
jgi:alkylation response protein AidB-like acyl-CoA dehydrogenase